jgi:hypothetical protein
VRLFFAISFEIYSALAFLSIFNYRVGRDTAPIRARRQPGYRESAQLVPPNTGALAVSGKLNLKSWITI